MASVVAVCISEKKGTVKKEVESVELKTDWGIVGDAHAGKWHRQVSLLAKESIDTMREQVSSFGIELQNGSFGENIITQGVELKTLPIGAKIKIGCAILELTQIGKECHEGCQIKKITGKCIMPKEGVFCKVLEPAVIKKGDIITII